MKKPKPSFFRAALLLLLGLCLAPPFSSNLAALSPDPDSTLAPTLTRVLLPVPQTDSFTARFNQAMLTVYNAKTPADLEKAAQEFIAARALNPSSPEVHYNLGLVYLELDEYGLAAECFREYIALSPGAEDAARARGLLAEAIMMQQRLEAAKKAMLNPSAWTLLERPPAELPSGWFPTEFRLSKDGRLQVKNPRLNFSPLDKEAETKRNPWLAVDFQGRYFSYIVCLAVKKLCEYGTGWALIQGEIIFDGARTLVIGRHYAYNNILKKPYDWGANYVVVYELR